MKSTNKYYIRELLNHYGIFNRINKNVCIYKFYNKKNADNYCNMMNDNPKGDVLEKGEIIKKASK